MDFHHFYGHVEKILFTEFILNTNYFSLLTVYYKSLIQAQRIILTMDSPLVVSIESHLFVCPISIWNDLRPTSNTTYSTHLWHFSPASWVPQSLDLTQGIQQIRRFYSEAHIYSKYQYVLLEFVKLSTNLPPYTGLVLFSGPWRPAILIIIVVLPPKILKSCLSIPNMLTWFKEYHDNKFY